MMQWFYKLKLAGKILTIISLMAISLGIVGFIGYSYTVQMSNEMNEMYTNSLLSVKWLNEARAQTRAGEALTLDFLNPANTDKGKEQKDLAEAIEKTKQVDKLLDDYKKTPLADNEKERNLVYEDELKIYRAERQKAIDMALAGQKQEAYIFFTAQAVPHLNKVNDILTELAEFNSQQAEQTNEKGKNDSSHATHTIIIVSIISMVIAFAVGLWFARYIARRLSNASKFLNQVAHGNLDLPDVVVTANDEIGIIGQDVTVMKQSLHTLIKQVANSAEQVAASSEELTASAEQSAQASNQVASTINDLALGAERQHISVDETSDVINQIAANIQQVAVNANNVASTTDKTANASREGGKSIESAINQMDNIQKTVANSAEVVTKLGESSKEIGSIVDTISGIAGQTNLLALNAAIEAARAGEQGRGFAVVAEEVRKLAEQSQEAAKKIAALIHEIQGDTDKAVVAMNAGTHEVEIGTEVVASAGNSFKEIAELISDVSTQVNEISSAIQQMAGGSKQVVVSINTINEISKEAAGQAQSVSAATEEQSASMEEIAASSRNLAKMAEELQSVVSKFKL